jgi:HEAT repeat protein
MPKLGSACLCLILILHVGRLLHAAPAGEDVPTYHGKTLNQWTQLARDDDPKVRLRAVQHLGLGPFNKAAVPTLRKALKDNDRGVRLAAVAALGEIGNDADDAVDDIRDLFGTEDSKTCALLCKTLGNLGPSSIPGLIGALKHRDREVRETALNGLKTLGPKSKAAVSSVVSLLKDSGPDSLHCSVWSTLVSFGEIPVPAVTELLSDPDLRVQRQAMDALGEMGPVAKAAVSALIKKLEHPDPDVRERAAYALQRIGPAAKDAAPALTKMLKDPEQGNRHTAAAALGRLGKNAQEAIPSLIEMLAGDAESARKAAEALGDIGEDALPVLRKAAADESLTERVVWALLFMGKAGGSSLKYLLNSPERPIRLRAMRGFSVMFSDTMDDSFHVDSLGCRMLAYRQ